MFRERDCAAGREAVENALCIGGLATSLAPDDTPLIVFGQSAGGFNVLWLSLGGDRAHNAWNA